MRRPQPPWWIGLVLVAIVLLGVAAGLIVGAFIKAAHAHGNASWIMNAGYLDRFGTHCCGPSDCDVAKPGEIERISGAWRHVPTNTLILDGEQGVYPSIDVQLWRCVRGGQLKCVFPGAGL